MTHEEYDKLQVERAMLNWQATPIKWWRPVPAEEAGSRKILKHYDKVLHPHGVCKSEDNPQLGLPPGQMVCGSRINLATQLLWTQSELDEINSIEPYIITNEQTLVNIKHEFTDPDDELRITELTEFASINDLNINPIIEEQIKLNETEVIIAQPIIVEDETTNPRSASVIMKFIKPRKPQVNNKELLRQLAERRKNRIRNPKFFLPASPISAPATSDLKYLPPVLEQDKLHHPFIYLTIDFPDTEVSMVRSDLWELACGKCYLKQTHFIHQREIFLQLHTALSDLLKYRDHAFEKFTFAMKHNLLNLKPIDDEPQFDHQKTYWLTLKHLRRLLHRLGRLSGIIKSKRGITTQVDGRNVNMDECWVALFEENHRVEPHYKLTDEELLEEMFNLFPHMRAYHDNRPTAYNVQYHRQMFNCGYFHCQGKLKPTRKSYRYRRLPSTRPNHCTVWKCAPKGRLIQNITPNITAEDLATQFLTDRSLKVDIRPDPNRGHNHRLQVGKARFAQIGQRKPLVDVTTNTPTVTPESDQQIIQKEVDGTIKYISEVEAEDFDPRLKQQLDQEEDLNF